ncbi:MarR family winged helix-turn-helix transcriptional regulator [Lutibaculum baratangense]|uniref:Transcriptional regulator, MarR family n=1 Tax=Lutibaculum baratangense AMV1 TaxID=631454 RepID=V4TAI8_9HYPH|nr:MarR family transcriptional regulator [Lutibaculum baratangense]ESR23443.1 Transcriptional regulator, MarR family [Lutibaculum baratangense AMV1]
MSRKDLLREGGDGAFRAFVHGLLAFTARLEATRNGLAGLVGLSGPQYTILISIAHLEEEGDVSVSTVAAHLHCSGAFVTLEVGRLVKKGLVSKRPSTTDRRRVRLSVTEKARRLLAGLAPTQSRANDTLFASLDARDLDRILELLPGLIAGGDAATALMGYEIATRDRKEDA